MERGECSINNGILNLFLQRFSQVQMKIFQQILESNISNFLK